MIHPIKAMLTTSYFARIQTRRPDTAAACVRISCDASVPHDHSSRTCHTKHMHSQIFLVFATQHFRSLIARDGSNTHMSLSSAGWGIEMHAACRICLSWAIPNRWVRLVFPLTLQCGNALGIMLAEAMTRCAHEAFVRDHLTRRVWLSWLPPLLRFTRDLSRA